MRTTRVWWSTGSRATQGLGGRETKHAGREVNVIMAEREREREVEREGGEREREVEREREGGRKEERNLVLWKSAGVLEFDWRRLQPDRGRSYSIPVAGAMLIKCHYTFKCS